MKHLELDHPCGAHFAYRDLIECGETWRRFAAAGDPARPFDNAPRADETLAAMRTLCAVVLDPVADQFGPLELTYAFASASLTRAIPRRIHPPLDQHAGHEVDRRGNPICPRLGLAADFAVPGVDAYDVASWIVDHTRFDRLYFYGADRPIHVSVGPDASRQIVAMRRGPSGRLVPRVVTPSFLRAGTTVSR